MNNLIFSELNLSKETLKAIAEMGFEEATPIQSQAIPPALEGKDLIGQAQTGTGKTCAFGIPAIERIIPQLRGVQVLILCPTRELAIQTAEELKNVAKYKRGLHILPIYGGQSMERQIMALRNNPQLIVGTPGRVMDHMRRNTLKLSGLKMLVLDEADEMLNMGFREDIDTILEQVPQERQTVLFSATMPRPIMELTAKYQREPVFIKIAHKELTVPGVEQFYLEVREAHRLDVLTRLIDANGIRLALVFCNTKRRVDELAAKLGASGYAAEALHGDMKQAQRDKVMARFREGTIEILIATDVAARGIDVDNIEAVFNYDLPSDEEYYVHRIGRTGRAGKTGKAYSFIFGRELFKLKDIQRYTRSTVAFMKPPSLLDVEESKVGNVIDRLKEAIRAGQHTKYIAYIEKLAAEENAFEGEQENELADLTTLDIAAALLKLAVSPNKAAAGEETAPAPDPFDSRAESEMVRLFINAGSQDRIQPRHIIESIAGNTSLPRNLIGSIDICDKFTFVDVPRAYADEVMSSLKMNRLNGRRINIEKANRQASRNPRARFNRVKTPRP
jgi:ATP-dependent RNA helicase DeaD